jgi:hypothetical protein
LRLDEVAARLTTFAWLEDETFALLGGWVPSTDDIAMKLLFAEQSHHHAWHASLWRQAIPRNTPFDEGVVDPEVMSFVSALGDDADDLRRLLTVARVLAPACLGTYHRLLATVSPASDGPVSRAATLIVADQERDRFTAEAMLDGRDDEAWVKGLLRRWPGL